MSNKVEIFSPSTDDDGTEYTFGTWLKEAGVEVSKNEPIAELETDKVTLEIHTPCDGLLAETFFVSGDAVKHGELLALITRRDEKSVTSIIKEEIPIEQTEVNGENNKQERLSPAVRKLVAENRIDTNLISGSGKDSRITKADVLTYLNKPNLGISNKELTAPKVDMKIDKPTKSSSSSQLISEMVPHTSMRLAIANHMQKSISTAPHVTAIFEMDLSSVIGHRKLNKQNFADKNVNLSFTAYFIAASAFALQKVPIINSRWHDEALEVFSNLNIGIGTALGDDGLIVPVIQDVQDLNLFGIARNLQGLIQKARTKSLTSADLKNGTFTISNHGTSGSLMATPIIINQPQSAILGIGKMQKRNVIIDLDGQDISVIRPMCYLSLTIDHRAIDGFQANQFLSHFVEYIESF